MANEIMVPALPCRSIDEIREFYEMLGFEKTYYQQVPNPYVAMKREDINIHFFGMPDFKPEDSYGTCIVIVPDIGELHEAFAAGMRRTHGKLLVSGIPRMTRPRKRKNNDNLSGFAVIDPGGNWIRISAAKATSASATEAGEPAQGKLGALLQNAVVMGDSHGMADRAAVILDGALERTAGSASAVELVEALAYRAELAVRSDDTAGAVDALARARAVPLSAAERGGLVDTFAAMDDLDAVLEPTGS